MGWLAPPYIAPMLTVSIISVVLALYAWTHQRMPEARPFALLLAACAVWTVTYSLELAAPDLPTKMTWVKLQYFGIATAPTLFLVFALRYTGRGEWLTPTRQALLWPVPATVLVLALTNDHHHLIWTGHLLPDDGPWPIMVNYYGPAGWLNIFYSYMLLSAAVLLLLRLQARAQPRQGWQPYALVLTVVIPWSAHFLYLFKQGPFGGFDLTPIAFTLMTLGLATGASGLRLEDILSVSHRAIIDHLQDGLLVLDGRRRIIDLNAAAQQLIGLTRCEAIGRPIATVWRLWSDLSVQPDGELSPPSQELVVEGPAPTYLEVRIAPVRDWRRVVVNYAVTIHDITKQKRLELELAGQYQRAAYLAQRDSVTGLLNHRAIHEHLEFEIERAKRTGGQLSVIMMDLDGFKAVNDLHGHQVGDQVLRHAASTLSNALRESDFLGRYGGDEFVAILGDTAQAEAWLVATRLLAIWRAHPPAREDGVQVAAGLSFGIATYPADGTDELGLLAAADTRLYQSKRRGGNTVTAGQSDEPNNLPPMPLVH